MRSTQSDIAHEWYRDGKNCGEGSSNKCEKVDRGLKIVCYQPRAKEYEDRDPHVPRQAHWLLHPEGRPDLLPQGIPNRGDSNLYIDSKSDLGDCHHRVITPWDVWPEDDRPWGEVAHGVVAHVPNDQINHHLKKDRPPKYLVHSSLRRLVELILDDENRKMDVINVQGN